MRTLINNPILPTYTDVTRPDPEAAGAMIFNTDDGQINVSNGVNWTLSDGTIT